MNFFWTRRKELLKSIDSKLDSTNENLLKNQSLAENMLHMLRVMNDKTESIQSEIDTIKTGTNESNQMMSKSLKDVLDKVDTGLENEKTIQNGISQLSHENSLVERYNIEAFAKVSELMQKSVTIQKQQNEKEVNTLSEIKDSLGSILNNVTKNNESIASVYKKIEENDTTYTSVFEEFKSIITDKRDSVQSDIHTIKTGIYESNQMMWKSLENILDKADKGLENEKKIQNGISQLSNENSLLEKRNIEAFAKVSELIEKIINLQRQQNEKEGSSLLEIKDSISSILNNATQNNESMAGMYKKIEENGTTYTNVFEELKNIITDNYNNNRELIERLNTLSEEVLSNIASVDEAARLLLINNIIGQIPEREE